MKSLFSRFLGIWKISENMGERFVREGVQFGRTIILARLLFPEDFGLFGLSAISLGLIEVFFQSGFGSALVREKGNIEKYLHTAWTVQVIRNASLATLVFLSAPYFGAFFEHTEVVPLIRVMSLALFVAGFENIGVLYFQKDLIYTKRLAYNLGCTLAEIVVVIAAAYWLRSPWALVFGALANRFACVFFSFYLHPFRPHFEFDTTVIRHLFKYGKWISLMSIVSFAILQGDNLVIGKLLGAEQLGYYQPAYALALIPVAEFGRVFGGVLFPMFAKMQEGTATLREAFVRAVRLVFALTTPLTLGLYVAAPDFVAVMYGERWVPMVPIISVLALYCLIRTFESVANPLFMGIGKPKIQTIGTVIQLLVMLTLIIPLTLQMGVVGAALAVFAGGAAGQIFLLVSAIYFLHMRFAGIIDMFAVVGIAGAVMFLVLEQTRSVLSTTHGTQLLLLVTIGGVTYVATLYLFDLLFGKKILTSLRWIGKRV